MTCASLAEVVHEDFIRTARAKGLRERIVIRRHALRAALSPVIGLVSVNVALLVTNVIVIERAFNLPGFFRVANVGQFGGLGDSGARRTEPPISLEDVQALIVEASLLIALTMFLADVVRAKLDPRVRRYAPRLARLPRAWTGRPRERRKPRMRRAFVSSGGGIRTRDLRVMRPIISLAPEPQCPLLSAFWGVLTRIITPSYLRIGVRFEGKQCNPRRPNCRAIAGTYPDARRSHTKGPIRSKRVGGIRSILASGGSEASRPRRRRRTGSPRRPARPSGQ